MLTPPKEVPTRSQTNTSRPTTGRPIPEGWAGRAGDAFGAVNRIVSPWLKLQNKQGGEDGLCLEGKTGIQVSHPPFRLRTVLIRQVSDRNMPACATIVTKGKIVEKVKNGQNNSDQNNSVKPSILRRHRHSPAPSPSSAHYSFISPLALPDLSPDRGRN